MIDGLRTSFNGSAAGASGSLRSVVGLSVGLIRSSSVVVRRRSVRRRRSSVRRFCRFAFVGRRFGCGRHRVGPVVFGANELHTFRSPLPSHYASSWARLEVEFEPRPNCLDSIIASWIAAAGECTTSNIGIRIDIGRFH